jgi:hypothetical protein
MAIKSSRGVRIESARQLRVLASPVCVEIIQALRSSGPATVAQMGPLLGRRSNSLHYHVAKLLGAGFLRKQGQRRSGARIEAAYAVTARAFIGETAPRDPELRRLTKRVVASLLRLANRNYARSLEGGTALVETGPGRTLLVERHKAWLSPTELSRLNRHVEEIRKLFASAGSRGRAGKLAAFTMVLTPERSGPPKDRQRG